LIGRVSLVVTFAAVVALVLIFARPISLGAHALVDATSRLFGSSKSTELLTASTASESTASQTRTASASVAAPVPAPVAQPAPAASAQPTPAAIAQPAPTTVAQASSGGQQLSLSTPAQPLGQEPSGPKVMVRGVTDTEIRRFPRRSAARTSAK
jgi:hypothetical protein